MPQQKRRKFLKVASAGALLSALPRVAVAAIKTPAAAEGPFYPRRSMRFADVDNDLVKVAGLVRDAGGEIIHLNGRVIDESGNPISRARVEIWQCDANGRYLHTGDSNSVERDPGFQGFGHDITKSDGQFSFRTIKPVSYPGRTPHIHVKILSVNQQLTTQLYLHNHPLNSRDFLYVRMSKAQQNAVEMRFAHVGSMPTTVVDIII